MSQEQERVLKMLEEFEGKFKILEYRMDVGEVIGKVDQLSKRVDDFRHIVNLVLWIMLPILAAINGLAVFLTKLLG